MFLVQKWLVFELFFQAIQARKMSLTIFQNKKTLFQAIKTRSSNSRKIVIFSKGLTHGLVQKRPFCQLLFLRQYRPGKCFLRYSRTKKNAFQAIKTTCSKSRKIDIFPKWLTHSFGPKKVIFPTFFLGNIGQENVFYDILERKNTLFQAIKTRS